MKKYLLNKFFVLVIFELFIGLAALSSGFSADAIINSNEPTLPDCETCIAGCDLEMVKIFPYIHQGHFPFSECLAFSCKIKNIGSETCLKVYGFQAQAYKLRTNKEYRWTVTHTVDPDGLKPGEEANYYSYGLFFDRFIFPPTLFRLNFTVYPFDSNTQNNYAEAIYLIWGGFILPCKYIKIKDIY